MHSLALALMGAYGVIAERSFFDSFALGSKGKQWLFAIRHGRAVYWLILIPVKVRIEERSHEQCRETG